MNSRIKGKTILITGASGGLGEQIAYKCAENGANVVLVARSYDKLIKLKETIEKAYSVNVSIYQLDVGDLKESERIVLEIMDKVGVIDVLVNNAGFGKFSNFVETSIEEVEMMYRVNVFGLIMITKKILPMMTEQKSGHIINIASQAGRMATPKSSIYASSKAAVLKFSDSLRMEVQRDHIFVTTVNPGPIRTSFFDTADETGKYLEQVGRWVLDPGHIADKIVTRMFMRTREINLPKLMNIGSTIHMLFPNLVEKIAKKSFYKK